MTVDEIRRRVEDAERVVAHRAGQRDHIATELAKVNAQVVKIVTEVEAEALVQDILTKASALSWAKTKGRIEALVDTALRAVFTDRSYKFVIEQETKRGASSVNFTLVEGDIEADAWDEAGLGVSDVIGFALRVAYLSLYRPKVRQLLIWDEPFTGIARVYIPNMARLVKQVSKDLGIQMIVITHDPDFVAEADQVIQFEKTGDTCQAVDQTVRG